MAEFGSLVRTRAVSGKPVVARGVIVTPQARALAVRLPFGAWVWVWPTGLSVEREGQVEHVPIVDTTRLVQWTLTAAGIAAAILTVILRQR